jgi:AP-4 complex subunit beta-1
MLKHLEVLLRKPAAKGIFDDEFRQFFVRYNESPHVKYLKVELLPLITNPSNARDIASELSEYVTDVDAELSKRAIRSIGEIAMRIDGVADEMTMALLQLIDMDSGYVRSQAATVLVNVVRVTPSLSIMVLPYLSRMLKRVDDATAKASLVWMLGEFGDSIIEAPYMLETIINNYEEEQSVAIKLQLLSAAMKLFFKRPPEMQRMLGKLFSFALNETSNQDLHDRALLYYRLLSSHVQTAEAIFKTGVSAELISGMFAENMASERINALFAEFNTLAVVYGKPSVQFIAEPYQCVSYTVFLLRFGWVCQNMKLLFIVGLDRSFVAPTMGLCARPFFATSALTT